MVGDRMIYYDIYTNDTGLFSFEEKKDLYEKIIDSLSLEELKKEFLSLLHNYHKVNLFCIEIYHVFESRYLSKLLKLTTQEKVDINILKSTLEELLSFIDYVCDEEVKDNCEEIVDIHPVNLTKDYLLNYSILFFNDFLDLKAKIWWIIDFTKDAIERLYNELFIDNDIENIDNNRLKDLIIDLFISISCDIN